MRHIAAFFLPPLACLLCGRLLGTLANAFIYLLAWALLFVHPLLGVLAWLLCALHAFSCADDHARLQRQQEMNLMLVAQGHDPLPLPTRPLLSGVRASWLVVGVMTSLILCLGGLWLIARAAQKNQAETHGVQTP